LQRRKTRTRPRNAGAVLAAALCLAGCGGGNEQRAAPQPKLQPRVARALAAQSDRVAHALDAGDDCTALTLARQLQQQTIDAINRRSVPAVFQEPLQDRVNDIAARIRCVPPAVDDEGPPAAKDHGKHKDEDKGKGKKKHHKGHD
jgi:hypothetical protein